MEEAVKLYWQPGCSSCIKAKEFLAELGVRYEAINVAARPSAMEELRALGVRSVPVVTRGREFVFAQELDDVSRFLGRTIERRRLPPEELMRKWLRVLRAAQRFTAELAPFLEDRATPARDRSVRELACHVFQVADAFLRAVQEGEKDLAAVYNAPPPTEVRTADDIVAFGEAIIVRLEHWWGALEDRSCASMLDTYYGHQRLHHVLERSTWHSAQHARQLQAVLEERGMEAGDPLTEGDYAGLPMPVGLWD